MTRWTSRSPGGGVIYAKNNALIILLRFLHMVRDMPYLGKGYLVSYRRLAEETQTENPNLESTISEWHLVGRVRRVLH